MIDISPHSYIKDGRLWIHAERGSPLMSEVRRWDMSYDSVQIRHRDWNGKSSKTTPTAITACVDLEGISPRDEDDLPDSVQEFLDDYVGGYA